MTSREIAEIVQTLVYPQREWARNRATPNMTREEFFAEYLLCYAARLGVLAAEQCAPGEPWAPVAMLDGDWDALVAEAARIGAPMPFARDAIDAYRNADLRAVEFS